MLLLNNSLCFILFACFYSWEVKEMGSFPLGVLGTLYSSTVEETLELAEKFTLP